MLQRYAASRRPLSGGADPDRAAAACGQAFCPFTHTTEYPQCWQTLNAMFGHPFAGLGLASMCHSCADSSAHSVQVNHSDAR